MILGFKFFLSKKKFNQFYLLKSQKKLSKSNEYKEFNGFGILKKNYKKKFKINSNLELKKNTYYWKFYDTSTSTEFLFKIDKFFQKTSIEYKKKIL